MVEIRGVSVKEQILDTKEGGNKEFREKFRQGENHVLRISGLELSGWGLFRGALGTIRAAVTATYLGYRFIFVQPKVSLNTKKA